MSGTEDAAAEGALGARRLRVRGVVQGVGFRPFVYRLAAAEGLSGWVLNGEWGVEIHVEGASPRLRAFARRLAAEAPPAAVVAEIAEESAAAEGLDSFEIRTSERGGRPTTRIAPDLPVCAACERELFDEGDPRLGYPYINCTDCGPRYSIVLGLPYDRSLTTMRAWPMCERCAAEYDDPLDRRFHAQPVACPECGPTYRLEEGGRPIARGLDAVEAAARRLAAGAILAIKGVGGYHLACDATDAAAVGELRRRKFRKEKPFALMAPDLDAARALARLSAAAEELLVSPARPIVLAPARRELAGVAPDNLDLGVMLPYAPLHLLLFAAGAPRPLVLTSANRSSEPIAYRDEEALERLAGIADAFLLGERPIARRVDDSVVGDGPRGPVLLRRSRGYAPSAVAALPATGPVLALGADLKNTVTLVASGEAFVSQHIGDLGQYEALGAFRRTIGDLLGMYEIDRSQLQVVHDLHPQYLSTGEAERLEAASLRGVQHHRAHVASVVGERGEWERRLVGLAFDGTGYGDDGAIWGGEIFVGSLAEGLERRAHLRYAALPGGDAAARHPVQASAGFLAGLEGLGDLMAPPFELGERYRRSLELLASEMRSFATSSTGRLFDTVAALLGFTRAMTFEGQAAIWLEHLARRGAPGVEPLPLPFAGGEIDYRPALLEVVRLRRRGVSRRDLARAFHLGLAEAAATAAREICAERGAEVVVLTGGVFQNRLLLAAVVERLEKAGLEPWVNRLVPANDGGVSFGQAALAALERRA